jgi:hypothetical protein
MGDMFRAKCHMNVWRESVSERMATPVGTLKVDDLGVILYVASTYRHQGVRILSKGGLVGWVMGSDLEVIRDEEG